MADPLSILGDIAPVSQLLKSLSLGAFVTARGVEFLEGEPTRAGAEARLGDTCGDCGKRLEVDELKYVCPDCGRQYEPADLDEIFPPEGGLRAGGGDRRRVVSGPGRLTIVGPGAPRYQAHLDRSKPSINEETQVRSNYDELLRWNKEFANRKNAKGKKFGPIPRNVLQDVAADYFHVQRQGVRRNQNKKKIIAALVRQHCIRNGFTRSPEDIAQFAKLPNNGIARGTSRLHAIVSDTDLELDMNLDITAPHITTVFSVLGLDGEEHARLRAAAFAVVKTAEANHLNGRSTLNSRVIAVTYEVLRRAPGVEFSIERIAGKCKIRKHTMTKFLTVLSEYRSYFEPVFEKFGLPAGK